MNPKIPKLFGAFLFFSSLLFLSYSFAQGLYTARGYWVESTKANYVSIKKRQVVGDSVTTVEQQYLQDYEAYLTTYYSRLSDEEKIKYDRMKDTWQREATTIIPPTESDPFEPKKKNRLANGFYGFYYGLSIVAIAEIDDAAAIGLPLITSGLWMLGPAINSRKYENITANTIRLSNTGRMLGLGYGAALGLTVGGESDNTGKWILGLSSAGSIVLGEVGFHLQQKKNFSAGHIDLMRHYSFLGAWTGLAVIGSTNTDNSNLIGASLLAGGIPGLFIGNNAAKKYNYTRGDVDAISSLSLISAGIGFTAVLEVLNNSDNANALVLIPAAGSIAGTLIAQKSVRGSSLTDKQGSIINLSCAGAALVGLGVSAFGEFDSPALVVGVPSALALITHQVLLHKFKTRNIADRFQGRLSKKHDYKISLKVMPENYFVGKMIEAKPQSQLFTRFQSPLATLRISFGTNR